MRRYGVVMTVVILLSAIGCDDKSDQTGKPDGKPDTKNASREELVDLLIARGKADGKDSGGRGPYWLALVYAPDKPGLKATFKSAGEGASYPLELDEAKRLQATTQALPIAMSMAPWPKVTPETDRLELRILVDGLLLNRLALATFKIRGDEIRCLTGLGDLEQGEVGVLCFLDKPGLTPGQLAERYGKPTAEFEDDDGNICVNYGRIRLLTTASGEHAMVFFPRVGM